MEIDKNRIATEVTGEDFLEHCSMHSFAAFASAQGLPRAAQQIFADFRRFRPKYRRHHLENKGHSVIREGGLFFFAAEQNRIAA